MMPPGCGSFPENDYETGSEGIAGYVGSFTRVGRGPKSWATAVWKPHALPRIETNRFWREFGDETRLERTVRSLTPCSAATVVSL